MSIQRLETVTRPFLKNVIPPGPLKCYSAGPLDRKTAHLIKLGMSIGAFSEGSTHTHVRLAKEAGATDEEIKHVALLALTTLGWPILGAAWSWINDIL
jgi:alkylhydroperoxidase/carboxymuconolactone decarboxylase family protein YurZ